MSRGASICVGDKEHRGIGARKKEQLSGWLFGPQPIHSGPSDIVAGAFGRLDLVSHRRFGVKTVGAVGARVVVSTGSVRQSATVNGSTMSQVQWRSTECLRRVSKCEREWIVSE